MAKHSPANGTPTLRDVWDLATKLAEAQDQIYSRMDAQERRMREHIDERLIQIREELKEDIEHIGRAYQDQRESCYKERNRIREDVSQVKYRQGLLIPFVGGIAVLFVSVLGYIIS